MSVEVSVVIVTYNSSAVVPACLSSLREHTRDVAYEVTVVDNASSDVTADVIAHDFPWVQLIHRRRNRGLSAGINDGVAASTGTYVAVINPDTRFEMDALAPLAAFLRAHPDAGVCGPKLVDPDGALQLSCRAFPGYATAFFNRYSLLTRLLPGNRFSRRYLMKDFDHASVADADWLSGAAMMFPRAVFDRVGGWDAGFFLFNEDVDFCKRVHEAGLRVVYDPEAVLVHRIGISRDATPRIIVERHRSMWRYYRKHLRSGPLLDAVTAAGVAGRCVLMLAAQAVRRAAGRRRAGG